MGRHMHTKSLKLDRLAVLAPTLRIAADEWAETAGPEEFEAVQRFLDVFEKIACHRQASFGQDLVDRIRQLVREEGPKVVVKYLRRKLHSVIEDLLAVGAEKEAERLLTESAKARGPKFDNTKSTSERVAFLTRHTGVLLDTVVQRRDPTPVALYNARVLRSVIRGAAGDRRIPAGLVEQAKDALARFEEYYRGFLRVRLPPAPETPENPNKMALRSVAAWLLRAEKAAAYDHPDFGRLARYYREHTGLALIEGY